MFASRLAGKRGPANYPDTCRYKGLFAGGRRSVQSMTSPWIRPADLARYERIGIYRFRITGRTICPEPWIVDTAEAYMARREKLDMVKLFLIGQ